MPPYCSRPPRPPGAFSNATQKKVERWARGLLRFPELLFQLLHKLSQALIRDAIVAQGSRPPGLLKTPLQFFSVALFVHGDTPSFEGDGAAEWFTFLRAGLKKK